MPPEGGIRFSFGDGELLVLLQHGGIGGIVQQIGAAGA